MTGQRISDMTVLPTLGTSGDIVPVVRTGSLINYQFDLAAALAGIPTSAALAASGGSNLVGFLQAGTTATARTLQDKAQDALDLRDYTSPSYTTAVQTADAKEIILEAIATGKAFKISRGAWDFNDSLLPTGVLIDGLTIFGENEFTTQINNTSLTALFNIGNSRFVTIRDLAIFGNGLTGATGNGHAIAMTNPGTIGTDAFYPSFTRLERLYISQHRGNAIAYGGGTMPACGIYMAGSLGTMVDQCWLGDNGFGIYAVQAAQPVIGNNTTFDANHYSGVVFDQCEKPQLLSPDAVGDNTQATSGTIKVGNYGVQSGGFTADAGSVVDYFSVGGLYLGGKFKNHVYRAFSIYAPSCPLISGAWIRQEINGCIGISAPYGVRAIGNELTLATAGFAGTRTGIKCAPMNGYSHIGEIRDNVFSFGGDGAYGISIDIDASGGGGVALTGLIDGNTCGSPVTASTTSTLTAFIKITGPVRKLVVASNHITVPANVTVTSCYNFGGVSSQTEEGLIDHANSSLNGGGTITAVRTAVGSGSTTGLLPSSYYQVIALSVNGTKVVGARVTGFGAMTGTATKTAIATYTSPTISAAYVQAEVQAIADALQAMSRRLKADDDALRAHGMID